MLRTLLIFPSTATPLDSGAGWVSLSPDGRAELVDGWMVGDVFYTSVEGVSLLCSSDEHSWSLVAR